MAKKKDVPLRKKSMQDFIYEPADKRGKFYMNENLEMKELQGKISDILFKDKEQIEHRAVQDYLDSVTYNELVHKVPEEYIKFQPINHYLIRFFRRVPELRIGNLILPNTLTKEDLATVHINAFTGQKITGKQVKAGYMFAKKAVVISVPSYENYIKPGHIVSVMAPRIVQHSTDYGTFEEYEGWFVHPDSDELEPVRNVHNVHFGFALYPKMGILGIIDETNVEPLNIKEYEEKLAK